MNLREESETHPALSSGANLHAATSGGGWHYAPNGWEDIDRGICPCGEVVVYRDTHWVPDRDMVVVILDRAEATELRDGRLVVNENLTRQLIIQEVD